MYATCGQGPKPGCNHAGALFRHGKRSLAAAGHSTSVSRLDRGPSCSIHAALAVSPRQGHLVSGRAALRVNTATLAPSIVASVDPADGIELVESPQCEWLPASDVSTRNFELHQRAKDSINNVHAVSGKLQKMLAETTRSGEDGMEGGWYITVRGWLLTGVCV